MWGNNNFEGDGNNFNQGHFSLSPFGGPPGQQFVPQMPLPFSPNGGRFINGEYQPELRVINDGAFAQNQSINSAKPQFSPPHFNNPPTPNNSTPVRSVVISDRAAELKAQLLKGRGRASATPPVGINGANARKQVLADGSSSLRGSPQNASMVAATSDQISELISQYAAPKQATDTPMKDDHSVPSSSQSQLIIPEHPAQLRRPSLGSPTNTTKSHTKKTAGNGAKATNMGSQHASSEEMSEGEIFEDPEPEKVVPATELKGSKSKTKVINGEGSTRRVSQDETNLKTTNGHRDSSPRRALPINSKSEARQIGSRRDEADSRQDRRPYPSNHTNGRPHSTNADDPPHQQRDVREHREDRPRSDIRMGKRDDKNKSKLEAKIPTLEELLPHDENLKDWLEITAYHNVPHRNKILTHRRALAALEAQSSSLEAQRAALLAEMEADVRGGGPAIGVLPSTSATMQPPPIPDKAEQAEIRPNYTTAISELQRDRVVSNKRTFSESQDTREESNAKAPRVNDFGPRFKQEDENHGRPRSSGYDSRRHSFDDRRDERNSPGPRFEGRGGRGRGNSRERENSPARKAYESRPSSQTRGYENGDDFPMRDGDEWDVRARDRSGTRDRFQEFPSRGGYKGRAFDPNYRGRGGSRGRGRGDFRGQSHWDSRDESGVFGAKITNGKPFKNTKGFDRGGKGG